MAARGGPAGRTAVLTPDAPGATTQLSEFIGFCEARTAQRFGSYRQFDAFAAGQYERFWKLFLEWSGLRRDGSPEPVCVGGDCEHAQFFPGLALSYVENLIDAGPDDAVAVVAVHASRPAERLTRRELRERVRAAAGGLRRLGVSPGDRVVAVAANNAEAVVAGLATAALGASFSTAPTDMGVPALVSRFEQLRPKVLLASFAAELPGADGPGARIGELVRRLPTLTAVVALDDGPPPGLDVEVHRLSDTSVTGVEWTRFPFNHPLFVAFTSGTTGPPKCIVHGAGGTLLEHLKEHRLHVDLRAGDRLFFHTSTGWMMWNWQLSALASGSAIVVYDGAVEGAETLWRIVSEHDVTVFGTSPPYLQLCEDSGLSPGRSLALGKLRAVLSTGSILHDWQYDWVDEHVGPVAVQSISGGTDIMGCFVLGNPELPVRRGWIQCRSLGLDVRAEDARAAAIGELVCANPFPSRPLGLVGDDGTRFHDAYFARNPGVWTHGDLIEFNEGGEARIHGRCDGVVNVHGIRIGPAEIYRALHAVPEVREAMAVEQASTSARGQSRLVLLVVLRTPVVLDANLTVRIRSEIARYASPAHVPELVLQVSELPTTHSGKRSEHAARYAVNGEHGGNAEALANPESVDEIARAVATARPAAALDGSTGARVLAIWEHVLGVSPLRPDDDFFALGGTSFAALTLLMTIHEELDVELPLSTLIYARTPAAVAALIDGPADQRVPPVVLLRSGTARQPLFVVHSIWGDVLSLRPLARAMDTDRPVYGLHSPALDPDVLPYERIEEMAEAYVATVRSMQPSGPYAIAGYSFGGLAAYEMARQLRTAGEQVEWLGLIDPAVSHRCLTPLERARFVPGWLLRRARARLGLRARLDRYRRDRVAPWARLTGPVDAASPVVRRLIAANEAAFDSYRPQPYAGPATFFYSGTRPHGIDVCDPLPIWRRLVHGELEIEPVPGEHDSLLTGPHAGVVAERVSARLANA